MSDMANGVANGFREVPGRLRVMGKGESSGQPIQGIGVGAKTSSS